MIRFSAVFNFRDLGGYPAAAGTRVRHGRLYRSDTLSRLADADRERFSALGIRTVLDLRRPSEVERDGRVPDWDGLAYRHVHPEHAAWRKEWYDERAGVARFLADRYLDLTEQGAPGLATAIGIIAEADAAPLVMHCVAGKDRTGVVAALVLALLGVCDDAIADDYARTAESAARVTAWLREHDPAAVARTPRVFIAAPREAMLEFLRDLRARHGSVERYLAGAGLLLRQVDGLRAHLLTSS
ncbi:MAG TPA: tyrosine-protein phosphatase [Micromonosporaceae bacterium]|nr:tyrosine-protein phosphatase [Micromonosporaceae bacterium]